MASEIHLNGHSSDSDPLNLDLQEKSNQQFFSSDHIHFLSTPKKSHLSQLISQYDHTQVLADGCTAGAFVRGPSKIYSIQF